MDLKEESEDNGDGIFSIDSCVNRCFEENNSTVHLTANKTLTCSCSRDCDPKATCCPDFLGKYLRMVCIVGLGALSTRHTYVFLDVCSRDESLGETTPEALVVTTTTSALNMTRKKIISSSTMATTLPLAKTTSIRPVTIVVQNTTTMTAIRSNFTTSSTTKQTTKPSIPATTSSSSTTTEKLSSTRAQSDAQSNKSESNESVNVNKATSLSDLAEIEDEHDMIEEDDEDGEYEPGNITNEKFMMQTERNEKFSFIITTLVITVSSIFFAFIAIWIVYKQYKKSTNPLNYKERSESGSKRADEEFSEIRYLTSDEALDFTLASPDNITDL